VLRRRAARLQPEVPLIVITPRLDEQLADMLAMLRKRRIAVTLLCIGHAGNERTDVRGDTRMPVLSTANKDHAAGESMSDKGSSRVQATADQPLAEEELLLRHLEILGCRTKVITPQSAPESPVAARSEDRMPGGVVRYG